MNRPTLPATIALLNRSGTVRTKGPGWLIRCPTGAHKHEDRHLSLAVDERDGKLLLKCFRGCTSDAIMRAIGMAQSDMFQEHREPLRETVYTIAPGIEHVRQDFAEGKKFLWRRDGKPGLGGMHTADLPLYGIDRLQASGGHLVQAVLEAGGSFVNLEDRARWSSREMVVVCEGEKAADSLWPKGYPAVGTITGASGTPSGEMLRRLLPRCVFLWPDNDKPGRDHMDRIATLLVSLGETPLMIRWAEAPQSGDAANYPTDPGELLAAAQPWTATPDDRPQYALL